MGVWSLGQEDPLEESMATQSPGWRSLQGYIQFIGLQRVGHNWNDLAQSTAERHLLTLTEMPAFEVSQGLEGCFVGIRHSLWSVLWIILHCLWNQATLHYLPRRVPCFSLGMLKDTVRILEAQFKLSLVPFGEGTQLSRWPTSRKVLQRIH